VSTSGKLAVCLALLAALAFIVVSLRRISAPVWLSVAIALAMRVLFAAVTSKHYTPNDVTTYFHHAGQIVLNGGDPLIHLPGRQWNFLQLMPYIFALEIKTGWAWVYAVKIAPILCDVLIVWLISRLAIDAPASRALQYAVNPLSLFVVSLHGQVEPVALALALVALLLIRRDRWLFAGIFIGAAIAAKTWPILIALAFFPLTRARRGITFFVGAVVVPVLCMVSGVLFLDTRVVKEIKHIVSYQSFVQLWGWSGTLVTSGRPHIAGFNSRVGHLGTALTAVAVIIALWFFRKRPYEVRALVVLSSALIVTAGFGVQYLLWPLPFMIMVGRRAYIEYTLMATALVGVFYLQRWPHSTAQFYISGMSWLVIVALARVIWETWQDRDSAVPPAVGGAVPAEAGVTELAD
jgi:hypothetical protein